MSLDPMRQQSNLGFGNKDVVCVFIVNYAAFYAAVQVDSETYDRSIEGVNMALFYYGFGEKIKLCITLYVNH